MESINGWNVALLAVAAYVAVVSLARLMLRRRQQMMEEFRREMEKQRPPGPRGKEPKPSKGRAA